MSKDKTFININAKPMQIDEETKLTVQASFDELSRKLSAIEQVSLWLERSKLNDYALLMCRPQRVFWLNVLAGIGRGIGFTLGFLLLGALLLYLLNQFINLPVIGDFIAELLRYIEEVKGLRI